MPLKILAVAGLRHESLDHAMERHVVVIALARELLDALGMLGREIVRALTTMRPLLVSMTIAFALSRLAGSGCAIAGTAQTSAATKCENSDHENSGIKEVG